LVGIGDVNFAVVVLERMFGGNFCEIVHDEDRDAVILAVALVDLIEYLGRFVDFEVDFAWIEIEDSLEQSSQRLGLLDDG
jgi:hypothetical protein